MHVHSTPTSQICSSGSVPILGTFQYCCDMLMLDTLDQFPLPAPNFAFGIARSGSVTLLNFNGNDFPQYEVDQYIIWRLRTPLTVGSTITANSQIGYTLRLFQFVISKLYSQYIHSWICIAPPPGTTQPTTGPTTTEGTGPTTTEGTGPTTTEGILVPLPLKGLGPLPLGSLPLK